MGKRWMKMVNKVQGKRGKENCEEKVEVKIMKMIKRENEVDEDDELGTRERGSRKIMIKVEVKMKVKRRIMKKRVKDKGRMKEEEGNEKIRGER